LPFVHKNKGYWRSFFSLLDLNACF
jgi:hypothetical protein